jgi:hypothetical protein
VHFGPASIVEADEWFIELFVGMTQLISARSLRGLLSLGVLTEQAVPSLSTFVQHIQLLTSSPHCSLISHHQQPVSSPIAINHSAS